MCFAVCDDAMMEKIRAMLPPDAATPRRALETALRRIALEVERLGLSVTLPVRPQGAAYEDLRLLTPRELEVLHPFMEGRRVTSIARLLSISPHTVRNHLQSIYRKLEVGSQAELIEKLRREIPEPQPPGDAAVKRLQRLSARALGRTRGDSLRRCDVSSEFREPGLQPMLTLDDGFSRVIRKESSVNTLVLPRLEPLDLNPEMAR